MGMESYHFKIIAKGDHDEEVLKDISLNFKVNKYSEPSGKLFKRRITYPNKKVILDSLVIEIFVETNTTILVESCFANYAKSIQNAYNLYKLVKESFPDAVLAYGEQIEDIPIDKNSYEVFKGWLLQTHKPKYDVFIKKYGKIDVDILPCDFYDYIRKNVR